jgi:beta-phosphoglucomutase
MPLQAAIFDLDGTMLDNNPFHILAWKEFYRKRGRTLTDQEFVQHFNGKTNADALKYVFEGKELTKEEIAQYTDEKESLYREIYAPHIEPVNGLVPLLELLQQHNIPTAIATSGIPVNIEYMFEHVPIRSYFSVIVNNTHISKGKPDPQVYLVTAKQLGIAPGHCLAFEDSVAGIRSAKTAGMKVIAVATTHAWDELKEADLIVKDFSALSWQQLNDLFQAG